MRRVDDALTRIKRDFEYTRQAGMIYPFESFDSVRVSIYTFLPSTDESVVILKRRYFFSKPWIEFKRDPLIFNEPVVFEQ